MSKDWNGNGNSVFKTLAASNHTDKDRQSEDYYATDPIAIDKLIGGGIIYHTTYGSVLAVVATWLLVWFNTAITLLPPTL